jgi:hypothetical protein
MASGILATGTPGAATNTTAYMVPNNTYTVLNVSFTNTSATTAATIRLYMGASLGAVALNGLATGSVVASEAIEYGTSIAPGGVFERTGLVLASAGGAKYITVYCSTANINVNIYGIETSTS